MDKKLLAKKLIHLAKTIQGQDTSSATMFKKIDPKLNAIVNKLDQIVGDDLPRLLTAVVMVMKKNKHNTEANQMYNLFKPILRKVNLDTGEDL